MDTSIINISNSAIARIKEIQAKKNNEKKFLRITVDSGGCNGFQYLFDLDDKINEDDIEILKENDTPIAITDEVSKQFLEGCSLDFIEELGGVYFKISNPSASSSCGCGASFSV